MAQQGLERKMMLFDPVTQEPFRTTNRFDEYAQNLIVRGFVTSTPLVESIGRRRKMAVFTLRGRQGYRGSPEKEYEVRVFGRKTANRAGDLKEGMELSIIGRVREFLEKDSSGEFVRTRVFVVASNYAQF